MSWLRKAALKRRPQRDPVTPELRAAVWLRDGGYCVAARLDPKHKCRDRWGEECRPDYSPALTIAHVLEAPRMGKRAPSDIDHTALTCAGSNIWDHWDEANRGLLHSYIEWANARSEGAA